MVAVTGDREFRSAREAQASSEIKPVLSPVPHAALEKLAALHGETSQNANLIFLLRSAVPAAAGLMLMGVAHLALGGGATMAGDFFWALALFAGIAALLVSHIANSAAAFDRAPLSKAAASLRRIYVGVGIAWGSGAFLALKPDAGLVTVLLFTGAPGLFLGLLLKDRSAALGFLVPVTAASLAGAILRPQGTVLALALLGAGLAGLTALRNRPAAG